MFHVVVDTDETASRVLDIMMREKNGRVTFMPLNRLKPKVPPAPNAQDAIPLLDKLRYDQKHAKAFEQVFGKTCVCRDLTIAAAYVKSHGINTITLDGDKVDRKGALTGGYHDVRRSRIEAIRNVTSWRAKYDEGRARLQEVKTTIATLEQTITRTAGQIQVQTAQQARARASREGIAEEMAVLFRERERQTARTARPRPELLCCCTVVDSRLNIFDLLLRCWRGWMAVRGGGGGGASRWGQDLGPADGVRCGGDLAWKGILESRLDLPDGLTDSA